MSRTLRVAAGSVLIACAVLALKLGAWVLTGSVALFADALESVVNVAAAVATLVAVQFSAMPPDANHPYGHTKAEYFSAVLEGALIVVAAIVILDEAWGRSTRRGRRSRRRWACWCRWRPPPSTLAGRRCCSARKAGELARPER
ncbi:cation diffusion facilitator family transporter [Siccirubricoccus deserti]